ncbi:malonate decarboxylase holo-ACP synthase [Brevibacillus sp. B_LB10_24]|uniref:malonate decarboxylase holo-ACP synthase n=1 Tax=Brevibacillus sp. B_LB10_24 TaxID=3380645 RepID=UPI0038B819E3
MEVRAHDLLQFRGAEDIIASRPLPNWVVEAVKLAPFAVVRRAPVDQDNIPVGIRGPARNQRFAAFLPRSAVIRHIAPEQLARQQGWKQCLRGKQVKALQALDFVDETCRIHQLLWGPAGSVGFELASGWPVVTAESDVDVVIRAPLFLPAWRARQIADDFSRAPVRIDVQIETPRGAVSLIEYARGSMPILLRTLAGPVLADNPWEHHENHSE